MTYFIILVSIIVWISLGCISRGYHVGYFAHEYPYFPVPDYVLDMFLGPFALMATYIALNLNHWRWTPPSKEEAWQAHHKRWPMLSYDSFNETWERMV